MKIKINTELEILDGKAKNVIDRFGLTKEEISNHIEFYFNHETLTSYSDIIVQLINDNRLDVVCCLASAYLMTTDKSVQPPPIGYHDFQTKLEFKCDDYPCPECGQIGKHFFNCGTGKK